MLPHEVNQLTIPSYSYMIRWILEEMEEQQKQRSSDVLDPTLKKAMAAKQDEESASKIAQARAYKLLTPLQKMAIGMRVIESR